MKTIAEIKQFSEEQALKINLERGLLMEFWVKNDFGHPYVKIDESGFHLISKEFPFDDFVVLRRKYFQELIRKYKKKGLSQEQIEKRVYEKSHCH
jgi:hypothetical protein